MTRVFGRIGLLSFGGPAAQIALMQDELVTRHRWLGQDQFLRALSFCMLLPGPEAMQLATYAGWRMRGVPGGLLAGGLFVIPGAAVIAVLAALYLAFIDLAPVRNAFAGIQALVVVILVVAMAKLASRALAGPAAWALALAGFVALFFADLPYPLVIAVAALVGMVTLAKARPDAQATPAASVTPVMGWSHIPRTLAIWGGLWALPIALSVLLGSVFLTDLMLFFSRLAVITFGGAYAVLAYMTQTVVEAQGWITQTQMIDALGLAETTPGPLILVTQFVGHLAGAAQGGWAMGALAGLATLWVTFVPCFLWIFLFAPYLERIMAIPALAAALSGVTAAVVGVIANLALWFALTVLFRELGAMSLGPITVPVPGDLRLPMLGLLGVAAALQAHGRLPLIALVPVMAAVGACAGLFLPLA
ncbi:MAG: chromate efflux transporter [Pseudomonadota bacterium]